MSGSQEPPFSAHAGMNGLIALPVRAPQQGCYPEPLMLKK